MGAWMKVNPDGRVSLSQQASRIVSGGKQRSGRFATLYVDKYARQIRYEIDPGGSHRLSVDTFYSKPLAALIDFGGNKSVRLQMVDSVAGERCDFDATHVWGSSE